VANKWGTELSSLVQQEYGTVGEDTTLARSQIELGQLLGKGEFGKVFRGKASLGGGEVIAVAVKQPSLGALGDFAEEVDIMCKVLRLGGHINIANMIGFVQEGQWPARAHGNP